MKTKKHTPGPWKYQCVNAGNIGSKDAVTVEANDGHIALIKRIMQENGRDTFGHVVKVRRNLLEVKANARLIAAAPDLLEAVKGCDAWLGGIPKERMPGFVAQLRAAIAKAEGAS